MNSPIEDALRIRSAPISRWGCTQNSTVPWAG